MKKLIFVFLVLVSFPSFLKAQTEKDIVSKITNITVYTQGAQIENEASFELQQGKMQLSFRNLSPYIKKESIRVDGDGSYTILNVQLRTDYLNQLAKNKSINELNAGIEQLENKIEDEETWIKILNDKIEFLNANKQVTGKEQTVNPEAFKLLSNIYGDNVEKYTLDMLKRQRLIKDYTKELAKLQKQLASLNSESELPSGTITVVIDSKKAQTSKIRLLYLVDNARWYPSYDIRFLNANKPLSISYKANIIQNTGVDWKDVNLKLSTAKTNVSAQLPVLSTNYLQFFVPSNTRYRSEAPSISNNISQMQVQPGNYLNREEEKEPLYIVDGVPQEDISVINPDMIESMEVIKDATATAVYGSKGANGVILITTRRTGETSDVPFSVTSKNETSNEFIVDAKQTIQADNKLNTITFKEIGLLSSYEYQTIPKMAKNAFLIAKIKDWYKADLLDGEANIYLENSFVGKSYINTQQYSDTLDISFGIDNNILVNREKIKDFSESQFIGANKKETYAWKITVRNNKSYPIKTKIWDQVPISSTKDIQVEVLELSGGIMNPNTGKVKWILDLGTNETKQLILKYSVKYPKDRMVEVE